MLVEQTVAAYEALVAALLSDGRWTAVAPRTWTHPLDPAGTWGEIRLETGLTSGADRVLRPCVEVRHAVTYPAQPVLDQSCALRWVPDARPYLTATTDVAAAPSVQGAEALVRSMRRWFDDRRTTDQVLALLADPVHHQSVWSPAVRTVKAMWLCFETGRLEQARCYAEKIVRTGVGHRSGCPAQARAVLELLAPPVTRLSW